MPADSHGMHVHSTYPTGAQAWVCPICNYAFIEPGDGSNTRTIVLSLGDPSADHWRAPVLDPSLNRWMPEALEDADLSLFEDADLSLWESALEDIDL